MIHLSFKELGVGLASIDAVELIAEALRIGKANNILVFYEFEKADELVVFCKIIKALPLMIDLQQLEEKKKVLATEIDGLENQKSLLANEIRLLNEDKEKKKPSKK